MRKALLVLALISLMFVSSAEELKINIEGYEGGAVSVEIFGGNVSINKTFENSSISLDLDPGVYHAIVTYKNLTAVKNFEFPNTSVLNFSFYVTTDASKIYYSNRHIIVGNDLGVVEIDIITNPDSAYFKGDLKKVFPENARNYTILSFTGNLENFSASKNEVVFENVVIPPNSSIQAVYQYVLTSNEIPIYFELPAKQLVLFTSPSIIAVSDSLESLGVHQLGSNTYNVYSASNISKGEKIVVKLERSETSSTSEGNDRGWIFMVAGALLILAGVGVYFLSRGKEEKEKDWKV